MDTEYVFISEEAILELVLKLRRETGMGMMTCRKCLSDYDWDYDEALANYLKYKWDGKLINIKI